MEIGQTSRLHRCAVKHALAVVLELENRSVGDQAFRCAQIRTAIVTLDHPPSVRDHGGGARRASVGEHKAVPGATSETHQPPDPTIVRLCVLG